MTRKRFHILDLDDGPDGGGGATLARILSRSGVEHRCWAPSTLSSGWLASSNVVCTSEQDLVNELRGGTEAETYVPGTLATLSLLSRVDDEFGEDLNSELRGLLRSPWGLESLVEASDDSIQVADHLIFQGIADRKACQPMIGGGWMLTDNGELHSVEDDGEAWYRLNGAMRRDTNKAALIPAMKRHLYLGAHYIGGEDIRQSSFMRVDSMRPSWRPALGRTVDGRPWKRANDDLAELNLASGFWQTAWLFAPGETKASFVASLPVPAAWLQLDEQAWVGALKNPHEFHMTPADRFYADAPIDLAIECQTLLERGAL
ncbi:MAG: hypothetical protein ACI97A_000675 [Planctomycetota bacterium]|jgi:hypothetical protein